MTVTDSGRAGSKRTMRFSLMLLLAAASVFFRSSDVHAHEIGTTQVSVVFQESESYEIEVVTDAESLIEKLEALSGQTSLPDQLHLIDDAGDAALRSSAELQVRLQTYDDIFRRRVAIAFDEAAVRPAIDYAVSGAATETSPPVATIRLKGAVPKGASRFAWIYSWTFATYSLTIREAGADAQTTEWLEGGQRSTPISLALPSSPPSRIEIGLQYLALGFTHIVPNGLDHMLFVLGIFLLGRRHRDVLAQVTAFTIAHSITLALSVYGMVSVSPNVVEPLIAVSIAYVAIENIFISELRPWRLALVFAFGLLHGMGFAGVLSELGLPRSEFLLALAGFNIGVEAGQLAVIGTAFLLVGWHFGRRDWYRRRVVVPASALIACTAVYWTFQRLSFLSL